MEWKWVIESKKDDFGGIPIYVFAASSETAQLQSSLALNSIHIRTVCPIWIYIRSYRLILNGMDTKIGLYRRADEEVIIRIKILVYLTSPIHTSIASTRIDILIVCLCV